MTSFPDDLNDTVVRTFDDGIPLLMPRWGYIVSAFVLFLIGLFGFFLNLMVILLMFKDRQLWTPLNIILFNLVCSEFSVSILGNPLTLTSALFHRWVFGHSMCVLYGFFMALLGITSITTLTVISFERYLMVTRPLSSRHLSSKGAVLCIILIWSYSLALTTPPLMGWGNYVNEAANISCSVNWHEQSENALTYILFLFAMGQIVPLTVITFSYVNIIRTMKKNSQRLGRVSRAESRATAMVFIMIIAFTVAWTPYSVFALMEQFNQGAISPGAGVIPALVAKSSICYNPLIYVGMNSQFRQAIKRCFGIHTKGRGSVAEKGFNNTLMSPAHKVSGTNEFTTRCNSTDNISSIVPKKTNKKQFNEDTIEVINGNGRPYQRNLELSTIQENKTGSDVERSGDIICNEESSNSNKKLNIFGESCHLNDRSPVLTIIDTERLVFFKTPRKNDNNGDGEHNNVICTNVYGNRAYEDDATENNKSKHHRCIKHSYSIDLGGVCNENQGRKLSIESKLETIIHP